MLKYNACAHARPGLRPFVPLDCKDHDPVFPVSPCCTRSVQYKVAEPRSYISALPDRDRCESCPMFTDQFSPRNMIPNYLKTPYCKTVEK